LKRDAWTLSTLLGAPVYRFDIHAGPIHARNAWLLLPKLPFSTTLIGKKFWEALRAKGFQKKEQIPVRFSLRFSCCNLFFFRVHPLDRSGTVTTCCGHCYVPSPTGFEPAQAMPSG
jgi:hypothetical protein